MQSYHHFTLSERECLVEMLQAGKSKSEMARELGRDRSSIYRELSRNKRADGRYYPWGSTLKYIRRRKESRRKYRLLEDDALLEWVKEKLACYWPPECIVAVWKQNHPGEKLSHCTLYRAINAKILPDGYTAKQHLRRRGKRRYSSRSRCASIKPEHSIHEREEIANARGRLGDWEGDTLEPVLNNVLEALQYGIL